MLKKSRFLTALAITIGILLVVSASSLKSIAQPPPPDLPHPLRGMTPQEIKAYAIAYSKREFQVAGQPSVVKMTDITGEDLQKVGVMYWGAENSFVLVILQGNFDVTNKWPFTQSNVSHTAFVLDPSNGLAALITDSPDSINVLAGEELAPPWPDQAMVPDSGEGAVPTTMP